MISKNFLYYCLKIMLIKTNVFSSYKITYILQCDYGTKISTIYKERIV